MVKSSFFCLCFGLFFYTNAQNFNDLTFHSSLEKDHFGVSHDRLAQLLMADESITQEEHLAFKVELDEYVVSLKAKRNKIKRNKDFISHIFYKTHRKYLKRYASFTSLGALSRTGKYDCLSATSLYSYLFSKLDIAHNIIEASYHIYINVETEEGNVLIESTDPIYGFVDNANDIDQRLNKINTEVPKGKEAYTFASIVNEIISENELVGLQYYNRAVASFNIQEYEAAINFLSKGLVYRNNTRTIEFGLVIAQSIMGDENLDQDTKSAYVNRLQHLFHDNVALASR